MKKNSFLEGTFIATAAIILVKVMGALYGIPFYAIIGEDGGTLYSYAYNVYNLFLNICTAGIPLAISKMISEYNALEMYKTKEKCYSIAKKVMFIISILAFFLMFVFAEGFAYIIIGDIEGGNSINDVVLVIRTISFCLLIIPYLSVLKGYLQGHKFIAPTSYSQVFEQVIRIAVILMGSYIAINVLGKGVSTGVAVAVSGAFFGGLIAALYLVIKIHRNKKEFLKVSNIKEQVISNKDIIKKIINYSIPFIIVSIATDIYGLTDMTLIIKGLYHLGYSASESELLSSIISTWGVKICMIINSLAIGLSASLIPHIVDSNVRKDYKEVNHKIVESVNIILLVGLPLSIGIAYLSNPIYFMFYGQSVYGGGVLKLLVFASLFASLHIVLNMILQSLNKFKYVYLNTIVGFVLNAILDLPLMYLFDHIGIPAYYGAIVSTLVGYTASFIIAFRVLKKDFKFKFNDIFKTIKKIFIPLVVMCASMFLLSYVLDFNILDKRLLAFLRCLIYAIICGGLFLFLTYRNGLLTDVLGDKFLNKITSKFKKKTNN